MVKKELILNGISVPLSENIIIPVNKSVKDIQEPDKASSDYTKTITLPSSKDLNKLLTYIFEINSDGSFNSNKKTDAVYLEDSVEIIRGYFQLKDIVLLDEDINYKGVVYGETSNFFSDITNLELTDIQGLDDFNHTYENFNQRNSWATSIVQGGVAVPFALGSGYVYPLINYGFGNALNNYGVTDMFPAFYKNELLERIFADAGYTWDSTFLDSDLRFKKEIIPFSGLNFGLSDAQIQQRVFKNTVPTQLTAGSTTNIGEIDVVNLKFTNTIQDLGGVYNETTGDYTVSTDGIYNVITNTLLSMTFTPDVSAPDVYANHFYDCTLAIVKNGTTIASSNLFIHPNVLTLIPSGTSYTTTSPASYPSDEFSEYISNVRVFAPKISTIPNDIRVALMGVSFSASDVITIKLDLVLNPISYDYSLGGSLTSQMYVSAVGNYYPGTTDLTLISGALENKVVNTAIANGDTIDMVQAVPTKVKQRDFVTSILNKFNLYVQPDRDNPKKLIILPREVFYTADIVDWSEKLDVSRELVFNPMGLLDANKYIFTYDTDGDYYNKLYLDQYNRTYGDKEVDIDNDFISNTKTSKLIFASTPIVGQSSNDLIVPSILKVDANGSAGRFKGKIRSLVYGGLKTTDTAWTHDGLVLTSYPYCGHFDDPFNPTFDNNFDLPQEIYYDSSFHTITLTDDNLYNRYHKKGIDEITDKDSKLVTGYFYLTPLDIATLDFRKQYFFKGAYFRLQKIVDYVSEGSRTTKCEFLKLKVKDVFIPLTGEVNGGIGTPIGSSIAPLVNITGAKLEGNNSFNPNTQFVEGENNIIDLSAQKISVIGDTNVIGAQTKSIVITGSNNYVKAGLENVNLINTNNAIVTESNTTYVNGRQTSGAGSIYKIDSSFVPIKWAVDMAYLSVEVDTLVSDFTIELPTALGVEGEEFTIKNLSSVTGVKIEPLGLETIDGEAFIISESQNDSIVIYSNGVNWKIK